jgi:hypothetical protein
VAKRGLEDDVKEAPAERAACEFGQELQIPSALERDQL